jgi:hypothetical protein
VLTNREYRQSIAYYKIHIDKVKFHPPKHRDLGVGVRELVFGDHEADVKISELSI